MGRVVVMSENPAEEVLPALPLLPVEVRRLRPDAAALADVTAGTVVLVDARPSLITTKALCRTIRTVAPDLPVIGVVPEGGLAALTPEWGLADVLLPQAGPAEIDARLRLATPPTPVSAPTPPPTPAGDLVIDASGYSARLRGAPLDLTYKEFELLRYLCSTPGRVHTRSQILDEVWGHDYYGGTRTVDVHVRRLRAKLGPEYEGLIGTVRNVGYRYTAPEETP